jgi:hypothetical protein
MPEIERVFGFVKYASSTVLRTRYFEVATVWRVVQKSANKVIIRVSDKHTKDWIATVEIDVPSFANSV